MNNSSSATDSNPLLELRAVSKRFSKRLDLAAKLAKRLGASVQEHTVHAVDQVSLAIEPGEVVGLVGESGCGKSTLGRLAAGLLPLSEGHRLVRGEVVPQRRVRLSNAEIQKTRLGIQMIFQNPAASLNPRLRVVDLIGEAPVVHGLIRAAKQEDRVAALMQQVGLDAQLMRRFPHQLSGGQQARIGIARALAVNPYFLVCDEAVAALDVSIQAQVINLFMQLRHDLQLTYLFISHDLGVVRHISDRVVIMYLGRLVESATTDDLFREPLHPYTQALLLEAPTLEIKKRSYVPIKGEIPSPLHPPTGCHFHPRCPHSMQRCRQEIPLLQDLGNGRQVACHLMDQRPKFSPDTP